MIYVDSRGAGEGKTTTGIYPRIDLFRRLGENVLIVVPSQHLQDQYERHYDISDFRKINSREDISVCRSIIESLSRGQQNIVCITHEAWMRLSIPWAIKQQWNLIIDEAIVPFRTAVWEGRKNYIDWSQMIELPQEAVIEDDQIFVQVRINRDQDDSWSNQISEIQRLQNTDWQTWTRTSSYEKLKSGSAGRAEFIQSLDISHIQGWRSRYIAAAAFDYTFMAQWLKMNDEQYSIQSAFLIRDLPVHIHCPEDLDWSRYKQRNNSDIIIRYTDYVNQICRDLNISPLVVRNNGTNNRLENEVKLSHNPHGINDYTEYQAVSLETALNPSQEFSDWLKQNAEMTQVEITRSFSSYVFYQILMRSCLRTQGNTQVCHIFLLDHRTTVGLADLIQIDPADISIIDVGHQPKPRGRRRNKTPVKSQAEIQKAYRLRKKQMKNAKAL